MLLASRISSALSLTFFLLFSLGCSDNNDNNSKAVVMPPTTPEVESEADPTPWPGAVWEPDAPSYGMTVVEGAQITMEDGVLLNASIGYPADPNTVDIADGTFPVLLTQNPYSYPNSSTPAITPEEFFVSRGYIHVVAEIRGTGNSSLSATDPDGPLFTDSRGTRSGKDGAQLVEWAAGIDRSDGRVGLYGCSWLGITQILTAGELEAMSPVKAMIPACAGQNYTTYLVGGVPTNTFDSIGLVGFVLGSKHTAENNADGQALADEVLAGGPRAFNGEYWLDRTSYLRVEKIVENDIPTLLYTGWEALEAVTGGVDLYAFLQNAEAGRPTYQPMPVDGDGASGKHQIIVGPGGHAEGLDLTLQLLWFDHWVKEEDTRIDQIQTGLHLYELGADRWINHDSWPITDSYTSFFLSDDGLVSTAINHSADIAFGDPAESGTTMSYDSAPLESDMTLAGPIGATVYIRSTTDDAFVYASLFDVGPDGEEGETVEEISAGGLLASARELDPDRSWYNDDGLLIKPEATFSDADLLEPGTLYQLDIELEPTLRRIQQGHHLRLVLATQAGAAKCTSEDLSRPAPCQFTATQLLRLEEGVVEIVSDAMTPSLINLPLVDPDSLTTAESDFTDTSPDQTQPIDWGTVP